MSWQGKAMPKGRWALVAAVVGIAAASLAAGREPAFAQAAKRAQAGPQPAAAATDRKGLLTGARSWGYQLQDLDAGKLASSPYDVLVIDFPGGDGRGFGAKEVAHLKRKPDGGRRLMIAYMNVGEAGSHRYYWRKAWEKSPPAWMGPPSCHSKRDHRVRHWAPEWQAILFGKAGSYLDRVIKAGFDGVYLDRVDIYHSWRGERWQGGAEMVDLVARLSEWAKSREPGFLVLPQNSEELLVDGRYRAAIDGIGKEDMLYGDAGNDIANHPDRIKRAERNFAVRGSEALPVLAVEYTRNPGNIEAARRRHAELGFLSYFGPRSLAYLGTDGNPQPADGDTEAAASARSREGCEERRVIGDW